MAIGLNDTIPDACTAVRSGTVLRLFASNGTRQLKRYPLNPEARKCPRGSKKDTYIDLETAQKIKVCDANNFAKPNFCLRMKVEKWKKCPLNKPTFFTATATYSEATNPSNTVYSAEFSETKPWPTSGGLAFSIQTASIGDPHVAGSSGIGRATAIISVIDDDSNIDLEPDVQVDFYLNGLGMSIDWLVSTPEHQIRSTTCNFIQNDMGGLTGFWTGINWAFGPVGLVMSLGVTIRGFTVA